MQKTPRIQIIKNSFRLPGGILLGGYFISTVLLSMTSGNHVLNEVILFHVHVWCFYFDFFETRSRYVT